MKAVRSAGALAVALCATATAAPTPQDYARCAAITAADARLACYDTLAPPSARSAATGPQPAGAPAAATTPAVARPGASPSKAPPAAEPAAPLSPTGDAGAESLATFGLSRAQQHLVDTGPRSLDARVAKILEDRNRVTHVWLDVGQVWELHDADVPLSVGDMVTIRKGALGSYLMYTPTKHSYHAVRTY